MLEALRQDFAVSKVVVSPNDTPFYQFEGVYARIAGNLRTSMAKGGAFGDCIDRWIARVEDRLIDEGEDPEENDFDDRVTQRFERELESLSQEEAGADFIQVIREYFRLKQKGDLSSAMQILSWLLGSKNVSASVKRSAGVKGEISPHSALTYLKGLLLIIKKAGHPGLLIAVDEIETILRMRADSREKSLNGIRQIVDAAPEFPGIVWLFAGTPDFFNSNKGVASLEALDDRIHFRKTGKFANLKQPQLELELFNRERLIEVALRLRELYPSSSKHRIMNLATDEFVQKLVDQVTKGFKGTIGIVPRQFLREFVDVLDLIDQNEDYHPSEAYEFTPKDLTPEEESGLPDPSPFPEEIEF